MSSSGKRFIHSLDPQPWPNQPSPKHLFGCKAPQHQGTILESLFSARERIAKRFRFGTDDDLEVLTLKHAIEIGAPTFAMTLQL